jgi:alanine dehydrogenase
MVQARVISGENFRNLVSMGEVVDVVEEGFKELALGHTMQPPRNKMTLDKPHANFTVSSSFVGGSMDTFATKIVGVNYENPAKRNIPSLLGVVVVNDPYSGEVLGIIDAATLTSVRTAACAAVAARHMARKDAEIVSVFGAGGVGRELIRALNAIRDVKKIRVIDAPAPDKCKLVCKEASEELGIEVVPVNSPKEAVVDADIIGTVTTSVEPLFKGEWLKEGAHISSIGMLRGRAREIDDATIKRAKKPIVADSKEHVIAEGARDIVEPLRGGLISENDIADLGDVVLGRVPVRTGDKDITLFKTTGLSIEDAVTANKIYNLAKTKNIGTVVTL